MHIPLCLMPKALGSSTHTMSLCPASPHVLQPGMETGVRLPYLSFLSTAESSYCRGVEDCSEEGLESRLWNEHMHNTSQRMPASVREVTSLSLSSDCPYTHSTVGNTLSAPDMPRIQEAVISKFLDPKAQFTLEQVSQVFQLV